LIDRRDVFGMNKEKGKKQTRRKRKMEERKKNLRKHKTHLCPPTGSSFLLSQNTPSLLLF
jgi:hypothetical protein